MTLSRMLTGKSSQVLRVGCFGRVNPPENRPWGIRDFTIDDPTGVLWRIGQSIESAE